MGITPVDEMSGQALTTMAHYILTQYACKPGYMQLADDQCADVVTKAGFLQIEPVVPRQPA